MADNNLDWRAVGTQIAEGMMRANMSAGFSGQNPTGEQKLKQRAYLNEQKQQEAREKAIDDEIKQLRQSKLEQQQYTSTIKEADKIASKSSVLQSQQTKKLVDEYKDLVDRTKRINDALSKYEEGTLEHIKLTEELNALQKEQVAAGEEVIGAQTKQRDGMKKVGLALAGFAFAVTKAVGKDVVGALKYGSQLDVKPLEEFSLSLGATGEELTRMEAASRQALNTMGGTANALEQFGGATVKGTLVLKPFSGAMAELTKKTGGDTVAALNYLGSSLMNLGKSGITPSIEAYNEQYKSFQQLQETTGMTLDQFGQMNERLRSNADIQYELQGLSEKERRIKLDSIRNTIQLNVNMGLSAEAAEKAATRLEELGGQKAKSRIVQAAKLRAMGGALGIEGGEEAQRISMKSAAQRTQAEQETLQRYLAAVSGKTAEISATGTLGQQLTVETLSERLGLDDVVGKGSPFVQTLAVFANNIDAVNKAIEAATGKPADTEAQRTIDKKTSEAAQIATQGVVDVKYAAAVADKFGISLENAVTQLATFSGAVYAAAKALGSIGGKAAPAAGGAEAGAGGLAGAAAKFIPPGAQAALKGAGTAAAGGAVIKDLYDVTQGDKSWSNRGALLGTALGMGLGTFAFPGVGTVAGAGLGNAAGDFLGSQFDKGGWFSSEDNAPPQLDTIADTGAAHLEEAKKTTDLQQQQVDLMSQVRDTLTFIADPGNAGYRSAAAQGQNFTLYGQGPMR